MVATKSCYRQTVSPRACCCWGCDPEVEQRAPAGASGLASGQAVKIDCDNLIVWSWSEELCLMRGT
jgi:hypothetical protein